MKILIITGALLMVSSANAQKMCDFEHHCYPDAPPPQIYHDLQGNVVPAPAPQYPQPKAIPVPPPVSSQVTISANVCKLAKIKDGPDLPARIVEICTMSDEEERAYREMARMRQASIPKFYPY
jgi:hypothetical protein